jgi:hypothetical protein
VAVVIGLLLLATPSEVLRRAERAFAEGVRLRETPQQARQQFAESARLYEQLRRAGAHNPDLYRNQGRAYLLAGELAPAILAFRRGLLLAPADRDLTRALTYARDRVVYPEGSALGRPPPDNRPPWLPRTTPHQLVALAGLLYALGWVMLAPARKGWLALPAGACLLGAALLFQGFLAEERAFRQDRLQPVVVIAEDGVLLRTGNGLSYAPRYETPVNRGVETRLLYERGDWLQIELAGGEVGWVSRGHVLVDRP